MEGKNAKLLAGGHLIDRFRGITKKMKVHQDFIWIESGVPSFGTVDLRLLAKGKGEIKLIYDSLKGGYYTKTITLK